MICARKILEKYKWEWNVLLRTGETVFKSQWKEFFLLLLTDMFSTLEDRCGCNVKTQPAQDFSKVVRMSADPPQTSCDELALYKSSVGNSCIVRLQCTCSTPVHPTPKESIHFVFRWIFKMYWLMKHSPSNFCSELGIFLLSLSHLVWNSNGLIPTLDTSLGYILSSYSDQKTKCVLSFGVGCNSTCDIDREVPCFDATLWYLYRSIFYVMHYKCFGEMFL